MVAEGKEVREFNGRPHILVPALRGDFAFVKAWKGDRWGNLVYRKTARNFNPVMATAADYVIAEVEEMVELGELDPDSIHTPGIFVDAIFQGTNYEKPIEHRAEAQTRGDVMPPQMDKREIIARRVAQEMHDGYYVNLGIGIAHADSELSAAGRRSDHAIGKRHARRRPLSYEGDEDPDLINAGKETVTEIPGCCYFSSADSFAMIRGGHIDVTVLGALQVDEKGNLANWAIPGKMLKGMGGAMDLVAGAKRVIIAMEHTTKDGGPKIVKKCTLPLTGVGVVDLIVTELAVIEVTPKGLLLREVAPGVTPEDVQKVTEPHARSCAPGPCKTIVTSRCFGTISRKSDLRRGRDGAAFDCRGEPAQPEGTALGRAGGYFERRSDHARHRSGLVRRFREPGAASGGRPHRLADAVFPDAAHRADRAR